jgi:hypothetical protein
MKSRSAPGSWKPTSKRISHLSRRQWIVLALIATPIAGLYVIESFIDPHPLVRIVLRTAPVLPAAIWTLWFDPARPLENRSPIIRDVARLGLLVLILVFAVAVLGFGLNWLYDPNRIV